jgi:hypothetical protein
LWKEVAIEPVFSIEIVNAGRYFAGGPVADGMFQKPMLFGELETDHEARPRNANTGSVVSGSAVRTTDH